jgi:hypothetical protein
MTEFEMAYLFNDMQIALGATIQYNFAITTAFLAAAYLAAHRLTRSMVIIVVTIYAMTVVGNILMMVRIMQSLAGLAKEIQAFAQAGKGLAWHAVTNVPVWAFDSSRYTAILLFVGASAASIYFFFHCRRVNRIGA